MIITDDDVRSQGLVAEGWAKVASCLFPAGCRGSSLLVTLPTCAGQASALIVGLWFFFPG